MSNFKHSFFRTLLYAQLLSGFSGVAIAAQISLSRKRLNIVFSIMMGSKV